MSQKQARIGIVLVTAWVVFNCAMVLLANNRLIVIGSIALSTTLIGIWIDTVTKRCEAERKSCWYSVKYDGSWYIVDESTHSQPVAVVPRGKDTADEICRLKGLSDEKKP
jgi:hypothetical protein